MDSTTTSSKLSDQLRAGRYIDVLLSGPATALIGEFVSCLLAHAQPQDDKSVATVSQERLEVGLAAFNAFLQANVTGPVLDEAGVRRVEGRFLGAPGVGDRGYRWLRKACLQSLDVDGVSVYPHIPHIELFCLARYIFVAGGGGQGGLGSELSEAANDRAVRSPQWLALRVNVWHYKLLTQPSFGPGSVFTKSQQWSDVPSLQDTIERGMEAVEVDVLEREDAWSTVDKVRFLVEKANVYIMLGHDAKAKEALRQATGLSGFVYALSGALGKRTRFQEKSTSQLVVLAKSGGVVESDARQHQAKPRALALNDDTLLENLEFTKQAAPENGAVKETSELPSALKGLLPDEQPQLSPLDQIILLAEATLKDAFSPVDTLTSEEVLPFAVRVISDKSTNWQIYTHALLVRSRIEVHRSRTVERGVLQMQAVVDQVIVDTTQTVDGGSHPTQTASSANAIPDIHITSEGDKAEKQTPSNKPTSFFPAAKPSETAAASVRLEHIHALSSPPRWHLESELAHSWVSIGSLVSALEIFKRLRLWPEVALCFASNAARDDEDGRGSSGLAKAKAVLRWRLFHKTGTPAGQQDSDEADEDANLDDLKEIDYHGPERQPPPPNAPRLWCILGDVEDNPAHYERAWEISKHRFARAQKSLGEYYIQQKDLRRAKDAYTKAVAANRLSSELWNRLGDISLRLGDLSDAAEAFRRAIAAADNMSGGEDARTWSNLGSALYSLYVERAKELKKEREEGKNEQRDEEGSEQAANDSVSSRRDPATLLSQSLAAYKRGAALAADNWRIWDNVITLASRLRPIAVSDLLLALRSVVQIRSTEDALDIDVLRLLLNEAVLSREKPDAATDGKVYEPPRGTVERNVCDFLESAVVPLITTRSELWELIARERVWRRDYAGAVDATERAWRAAIGAAASGGELFPSSGEAGGGRSRNWLEDKEAWRTVVERTDELVSMLENYGEGVPEIGAKWKGKARSALRSVMGKAKESWEGSEEWERLVGLLEGLM
ncbi:Essential for maintenance of the cell wall protein 1 [Madurella mycetomatis]|uniref:Essential for maintenance of the cell wall protein 1 n=1 Tax=Madurella mycetomatis TaxID=100816 RepID=A0A175WF52_9PEZI|nr:Essential for maintenance of the cell wall protein 1 [Madurella mycetomatis]